jgi:hypothetical protein
MKVKSTRARCYVFVACFIDVHGLHLLMQSEASSGLSQNRPYQSPKKNLELCNLNDAVKTSTNSSRIFDVFDEL